MTYGGSLPGNRGDVDLHQTDMKEQVLSQSKCLKTVTVHVQAPAPANSGTTCHTGESPVQSDNSVTSRHPCYDNCLKMLCQSAFLTMHCHRTTMLLTNQSPLISFSLDPAGSASPWSIPPLHTAGRSAYAWHALSQTISRGTILVASLAKVSEPPRH